MHKKSPCSLCLRCKFKKTSWCKLSSHLLLFHVGIKVGKSSTLITNLFFSYDLALRLLLCRWLSW